MLFLVKSNLDFIVNPPTWQCIFRATQQDLVREADTTVHLSVNLVSRKHVMFIKPASNASALECIVQPASKRFVSVAVTDKTRVKLNRLCNQRRKICD